MQATKIFNGLVALAGACLLNGCATEPTATELNFGDSVRHMIRVQTYDPNTLTNPSDAPVEGADGEKLDGVLEVYRSDVGAPETVSNEISINLGGGR